MLIQELERLTGLERPTIRYYEKEGLIIPERSENGYRSYSDSDVQKLIRIKLMRQLGVPIGKIKDLQDGTEDFSAVMDAQIKTLTSQIERDKRAKAVCTAILDDKADYATLNASYYIQMFESVTDPSKTVEQFKEKIPDSIHPWRRFGARMVDYFVFRLIVQFLLVVVFRIRPFPGSSTIGSIILSIAVGGLYIPIEALLLHIWGTTPGKMVFGIRIERVEGGLLSFSDSLERSKQVFMCGVGLGIPLISEITMFSRYCTLSGRSFWRWAKYDSVSPPYDMDWDYNNEIHYDEGVGKRRIALAGVAILAVALFTASLFDSVKPRFRGNDLTIAEFTSNYNNYTSQLIKGSENTDRLRSDGTWIEEDDRYVVYIGGTPAVENPNFIYQTENGCLNSVEYAQQWKDVVMLSPFDNRCYIAAMTLFASQEDRSFWDILRFEKLLNAAILEQTGNFQYENVKVEWNIETSENIKRSNGSLSGMYFSTTDQGGEVRFHFRVFVVEDTV